MKQPKLTILIPVFNEQATLLKILKDTSALRINDYEVIVVDDASSDDTPKIIERFRHKYKKKNPNFIFFKHAINKGKGAGIKTGLKNATGRYFIIQDADLEYSPKEIEKLLAVAEENDYIAVYGSRFKGSIKHMSPINRVANKFFNYVLRRLYPTDITDMHTCYKMVKTDTIKQLDLNSNGFEYATELISKLLNQNIKINEVPISFNGRTVKEGKKISLMDGAECIYLLLRFKLTKNDNIFKERSSTFWRFLIVGATGFFTNYLILVGLTLLNLSHIYAEIIAAIIALQVTFFLHNKWTYLLHTPPGTARLSIQVRYISYLISNSFGSLITVVMFGMLYEYLTRLTALLIAAVCGLVWNYFLNTYIIWRRKRPFIND